MAETCSPEPPVTVLKGVRTRKACGFTSTEGSDLAIIGEKHFPLGSNPTRGIFLGVRQDHRLQKCLSLA